MAILSDVDRLACHQQFADAVNRLRGSVGTLTRAELRAAVDAVDQWIDDNAAAYNQAIPQPARTALTAKQKAEILMFIVRKRFEVT